MRTNIVQIVLLAVAILPLSAAVAVTAQSASVPSARPNLHLVSATVCAPGTYWEPPGYVGSGKWRDGHCAQHNGNQ
jgi:hypothetical protein